MSLSTPSVSTRSDIISAAASPQTRDQAIDMAVQAMGAGDDSELVLELVCEGLEQDGHLEDAVSLAHRRTVQYERSGPAWLRFSQLLVKARQRDDVVPSAKRAVELMPDDFSARMQAVVAYLSINAFDAAIEHAQRASAINPLSAEPLANLATLYSRIRDFKKAREFALRALQLKPDLPGAEIALARAEMGEGRPEAAIRLLRQMLGFSEPSDLFRAEALLILGDALDQIGEAGQAFAAYSASNAVLARDPEYAKAGAGQRSIAHAGDIGDHLAKMDPQLWTSPPCVDRTPGKAATHVFILGFPRSGTTLLENALAMHPQVIALEETDALSTGVGDLMNEGGALERLARISDEEAAVHQEKYWSRVRELADGPINDKVVVDKFPTATIALPAIYRLFPGAKIIFALRDPRDAVWSCFRHLFGLNVVTAGLMNLENASVYYDRVMRIAETSRKLMPLNLHTVRHEDVVADFDGQLGDVLSFIGLDWRPEVRDFAARGLRSRTPSATQLASGLNDRGVGAWRRFQPFLKDVLPVLAPWVEKYGYPPAEPTVGSSGRPEFEPIGARIGSAVGAGDWRSAYALVDQAFADGFYEPLMFRVRGVRRQQEGPLDGAVADFTTALASAPGDLNLLNALALSLARLGRVDEALSRTGEALALDPRSASALFTRGFALERIGDLAGARDAYDRSTRLAPNDARALGALAFLHARSAEWAQARELAMRALRLAPALPSATLALAAALGAEGKLGEAEARLRQLLASPIGQHEAAMAQLQLGDILDRAGRAEEAFTAYAASNTLLAEIHGPRFEATGRERASRLLERLEAWPELTTLGATRRDASQGDERVAFITGFPRSGTTLLAQALGAHPACHTLDERPTLEDSVDAFYAPQGDLGRLARLDEGEQAHFRELYFRRAGEHGWPGPDRLLVDKMPTGIPALPIISAILPDARAILMLRDPRDVILSCFRRQFQINPTTIDLLDISGAAKLYDATMKFAFDFIDRKTLTIRVQKYESLVSDFRAEMAAVLAFLDLPWDDGVLDFASRSKATATPSRAQLAQGLSDEGVGAWRRYAFALERVRPYLDPWIERFGYAAN